jgi:hypothetical protein
MVGPRLRHETPHTTPFPASRRGTLPSVKCCNCITRGPRIVPTGLRPGEAGTTSAGASAAQRAQRTGGRATGGRGGQSSRQRAPGRPRGAVLLWGQGSFLYRGAREVPAFTWTVIDDNRFGFSSRSPAAAPRRKLLVVGTCRRAAHRLS